MMNARISKGCRRDAFTLVELLVVIAIIAVLASLLLPAIEKAKRSGQIARCGSNLHQIGIAVLTYASDQQDRLPNYRLADEPTPASLYHNNRVNLWGGNENALVNAGYPESGERKLTPYMGEFVGLCPLDKGYAKGTSLEGSAYTTGNFYEVYGTSYVYNTGILDHNGSSVTSLGENWQTGNVTEVLYSLRHSEVEEPSRLAMGGDRTLYYIDFFEYTGVDYLAKTQMHDPQRFLSNIVFVDGHLDAVVIREPPDHLSNSDYTVLNAKN